MSAFNIVRFRVKLGQEQSFIDAHREMQPKFKGFLGGNLVKTGDQTFCMIAEWRDFESLATARPEMIAVLDSLRDMLEDLGSGLGVTDPVSGERVAKIETRQAGKKAGGKRKKKQKERKNRKGKEEKRAAKKGKDKKRSKK